jgi:hypothetical protein
MNALCPASASALESRQPARPDHHITLIRFTILAPCSENELPFSLDPAILVEVSRLAGHAFQPILQASSLQGRE